MRWSAARITAGVLAVLLGSCGGASPSPVVAEGPPVPFSPLAPAIVSPARWVWSPASSGSLTHRVFVDASTCLLVGANGERWLSDRAPDDSCAGHSRAASMLAPQTLVGVRRAASAWLYFGYDGSVYQSGEPLGPLHRVGAAPGDVRSTAITDHATFVLTANGSIFRFGAETAYRQVGPDAYVTQLVSRSDGRMLALAIPEAHYVSLDGGDSWAKASFPGGASAVGAQELGVTASGDPAVRSVVGDFALGSGPDPTFTLETDLRLAQSEAVHLSQIAPSAAALSSGSAVIDGDRYLQVARSSAGGWDLVGGPLPGPLERERLDALSRCDDVLIAAAGAHVFVACGVESDRSPFVEIYLSHDRGLTFTEANVRAPVRDWSEVGIAGSPSGALLLTGACSERAEACEPSLPLLFEPTPVGGLHAVTISAPDVSAPVLGATFSLDGAAAYFVGFQRKQEGASLFSSRDAGRTFSVRTLAQPSPYGDDEEADGGDDTDAEYARRDLAQRSRQQFTADLTGPASLRIGEDGSLALRAFDETSEAWFLVNEASRSMRPITAPVGNSVVGAVGLQALAISLDEPQGAWESLNGGQSWTPITPHQSLLRPMDDFGSITCATSGCVAGDAGLIRQGWGGQSDAPPILPEPASVEPPKQVHTSAVGHSFSCAEIPGAPWEPLRQLDNDLSRKLPDAREVARGAALWSRVFENLRTGRVAALSVGPPVSKTIPMTEATMLGRAPRERTYIVDVSEGTLALRLKHGRGTVGDRVEFGWFNATDGTTGRASLGSAHLALASRGFPAGAAARWGSPTVAGARIDLVPGGALFFPHGEPAVLFRRDGSTSPISAEGTIVPPGWLPDRNPALYSARFPERNPALYSVRDGRLAATWLEGDGYTPPQNELTPVFVTSSPPLRSSVSAISLASIPNPRSSPVNRDLLQSALTRVGDTSVGVFLRNDDAHGVEAVTIRANPDGSLGPILPAVTPPLLPAQPRACSGADATSPRVLMPLQDVGAFSAAGGTVQVDSTSAPLQAYDLTHVVLGGTVASPCVHAWLARSSRGAVLIPGGSDAAIELSLDTQSAPARVGPRGAPALQPLTSARVVKCALSSAKP